MAVSDTVADAPADASPGREGVYNGRWTKRSVTAVAVFAGIHTFYYADRQAFGLVLPLIKKEMQLTDTQIGLLAGLAFVLFYSILAVPVARLADRSNRRNILAFGVGFWSLMTAISGLSANVWQLATARFLMGAGEAAGLAPLTSMVSDIFDRVRRPMAMAFATCGNALSSLIMFPILGLVANAYGWREAFFVAGVPGMILTVLLICFVKEPARTSDGAGKAKAPQESFAKTLRYLLSAPAYVLAALGAALVGISLYADQTWNASFLTRVHGLNLAQVGASIGLIKGVMGLSGGLLAGVVVSKLCRLSERWRLWVPGLACILVMPSELLFLTAPDIRIALVGLAMASFFIGAHYAQVFAVFQDVAPTRMRATAVSLFILCVAPIGQVIGPLVVGFLNDLWATKYGVEAIRYSLMVGSVAAAIGGSMMLIGSIFLPRDVERAART